MNQLNTEREYKEKINSRVVPDRIIEEVCLFFSLSCNKCLIAGQELAHEAKLSKLL